MNVNRNVTSRVTEKIRTKPRVEKYANWAVLPPGFTLALLNTEPRPAVCPWPSSTSSHPSLQLAKASNWKIIAKCHFGLASDPISSDINVQRNEIKIQESIGWESLLFPDGLYQCSSLHHSAAP